MKVFFFTAFMIVLHESKSNVCVQPGGSCIQTPSILVNETIIAEKKSSFVDGNVVFLNGSISPWNGAFIEIKSPILNANTGDKTVLGRIARMDEDIILKVLDAAKAAWKNGNGEWPQMSPMARINAVYNLIDDLQKVGWIGFRNLR